MLNKMLRTMVNSKAWSKWTSGNFMLWTMSWASCASVQVIDHDSYCIN